MQLGIRLALLAAFCAATADATFWSWASLSTCGNEGGVCCYWLGKPTCKGGLVPIGGRCMPKVVCGGEDEPCCQVKDKCVCDRHLALDDNDRCVKAQAPRKCGGGDQRCCVSNSGRLYCDKGFKVVGRTCKRDILKQEDSLVDDVVSVVYGKGGCDVPGFKFYPNKDSGGRDIRNSGSRGAQLLEECKKDLDCKGCNTNGWLKRVISSDERLTNHDYGKKCGGLYVKIASCDIPGFKFYPNKDSWGNDIRNSHSKGLPLSQECLKDAECKGYNTNGWLKHSIRSNNKCNSYNYRIRCGGLYVREDPKPGCNKDNCRSTTCAEQHCVDGKCLPSDALNVPGTKECKTEDGRKGFCNKLVCEVPAVDCDVPGFDFYPDVDSSGGDIERHGKSGLSERCKTDPQCKGYNSNGWVKHTIKPVNKRSTHKYGYSCGGLYVKSDCGLTKQAPCHSTCDNIVELPTYDVPGDNLEVYSNVVGAVACLQKCENDPHRCHSAVYNDVRHQCYTKAAGGTSAVKAATLELDHRLTTVYCDKDHPGQCPRMIRYPGYDMSAGMDLHDFDNLSRGECMDACTESVQDCAAAVYNTVLRQCYTKAAGGERMAIADEELKARLEVIECKDTDGAYCDDFNMLMTMDDGSTTCMLGD